MDIFTSEQLIILFVYLLTETRCATK